MVAHGRRRRRRRQTVAVGVVLAVRVEVAAHAIAVARWTSGGARHQPYLRGRKPTRYDKNHAETPASSTSLNFSEPVLPHTES
jgi:hypothetical protein